MEGAGVGAMDCGGGMTGATPVGAGIWTAPLPVDGGGIPPGMGI